VSGAPNAQHQVLHHLAAWPSAEGSIPSREERQRDAPSGVPAGTCTDM